MDVLLPPDFSGVRWVTNRTFPIIPKAYLTNDNRSAPAIFQFPGSNDDTYTRSFTSLATFRAMSSLFCLVFFHVYVRDRVKDVKFIMEHLVSGFHTSIGVSHLTIRRIASREYGNRYGVEPVDNINVSCGGYSLVSMHFCPSCSYKGLTCEAGRSCSICVR